MPRALSPAKLPVVALAAALAGLFDVGPAQAAKDTLILAMQLEPPHLDPTAGAASAIRISRMAMCPTPTDLR